jgi:diketogulonate reductase-like aldo/keto reductase
MPTINLGTCCGSDPSVGLSSWLDAASAAGFGRQPVPTGIDTAFDYQDQQVISSILSKRTTSRDSVFITTKVPAGFGNATDCLPDPSITVRYVEEDLRQLNISQVDLVLIHRPCQPHGSSRGPVPAGGSPAVSNQALWEGAQRVLAMNLTRAIGVSNYVTADLKQLKGATPSVNQCSMSLAGHDDDTIAYCAANDIAYESYHGMKGCPFSGPGSNTVKAIAAAHNASVSQVCLRWIIERGAIMAVGTGSDPSKVAAYAKENLDIFGFSLTDAEVNRLNHIQNLVPDR